MRWLIIILMFLMIGALFIISENNISLSTIENRKKFFDLYFSWLNHIVNNSKSIVGYAIKLEWFPKE